MRLHVGLRVELEWFDKTTEHWVAEESSIDLGEDSTVMENLEIPVAHNINNGGFDVKYKWLETLQPLFKHRIDLNIYDYQVSFNYRD